MDGASVEILYDDEWWAGRIKSKSSGGCLVVFDVDGSTPRAMSPWDFVAQTLSDGARALALQARAAPCAGRAAQRKAG